jgi:NtrC-family two-component system sensor histidine kinase KinB
MKRVRVFNRMLRTRLFLSLLPFVVILLAMGVYAIALFSRLANSVDLAVGQHYQSIYAAQVMSQSLAGMEQEAPSLVDTRTGDNKLFAACQKRFEDSLAVQRRTVTAPGLRELNEQLATNYVAYLKAITAPDVLRTPKEQRRERTAAATVAQMNALLEKIRELNYQAVLDTSNRIQQSARDVTRLVIIGMVIVLAITIYTCYQLGRSILQPIQLLTRATRELGEGNLAQPVPVVSRDELGELAVSFNKMAAQLKEYRQNTSEEIIRLHRTMETTLASFPDPIFVLNREGEIELKNPAAGDLAAALRLNGELPDRLQTIARKALDSGENFLPHSFDEAVSYRLKGAEKSFLPRILAMRDKENTLFGVAVVLYDVTRFRLLDSAKTNLVATVCHELNTPLTSVRMALHLLLERSLGKLTPKQDELLEAARNDTERLLRILNDLLDLARLEEGNEGLRKESIAPGELLRGVIEDTADKVSSRGLRINCTVEPALPGVSVDRQRISHVFNNLIANAIKYSPAGGRILLSAARGDDDTVEFSISDQGPGVPEEYHARIFERFFRAPGQTKTGAGLGLSIAREITLAHGGRIGVRSAPGRGSTFFVVLKAAER